MGVMLALWESTLNNHMLLLPGKQTAPLFFEQPLGYFVQLHFYYLR